MPSGAASRQSKRMLRAPCRFRRAMAAMAEAAAQIQKGLDQLALLPDSPERQQQELEFLSALGAALQAAKGYGASETGDAYSRARDLWP